jgi:hypothetical protein
LMLETNSVPLSNVAQSGRSFELLYLKYIITFNVVTETWTKIKGKKVSISFDILTIC